MADARSIMRLNWGCGVPGEPGWTNADIKDGPGIQVTGDILTGLPIANDTFDYAVSIHALPELRFPDQVTALRELRRVIKPGGVLRLALPDLERGIAAFQRGDRDYFLIPDSDARSIGGKLAVQLTWYGYSRCLFTRDFVAELLEDAGFSAITQLGYRQTASPYPEIVDLDNREAESLFVEASR